MARSKLFNVNVIARVARWTMSADGGSATFMGFVPSTAKTFRRGTFYTTQHRALTVTYRANRQAADITVGVVVPSTMLTGHAFRTAAAVQEYRKVLNDTTKVSKVGKAQRAAFKAANVL